MKKVLLYYYSQGNLGDDLFVSIVNNRYLNKLEITSRIVPTLGHAKDVKVHKKNLVWAFFKILGRLTRKNLELIRLLSKNDMLLYIGGSIFIENDGPNNIHKWRREKRFYASLNKPYYILGANFGPYIHDEFVDIARTIIGGAKDVCFRDTYSQSLFTEFRHVRHASDLVFSMETEGYDKEVEKKVVFSIIDSRHHFSDERIKKYESEVMKLTRRYIKMGYEVVYMSFCKYEGDEEIIKKLINTPGDEAEGIRTHFYAGDIGAALNEISSSSAVVATRFHATILGLLFKKPVIPFIYSAKTSNVLDDMEFLGPVYDMRTLSSDSDTITLDDLSVHDVSRQLVSAHQQFQELDKVLEKRKKSCLGEKS